MFPPVAVEISNVKQNKPPISFPKGASLGFSLLNPLLTTHMGPPCGLSGSSVFR